MAGTVIADRLEAASTSQLVIENGVALTPPTVNDVNGVQIGTFCRAWASYDMSGAVGAATIFASFNVSSISKTSTSAATVNFTNAMPDANYALAGITRRNSVDGNSIIGLNSNSVLSTSSVTNVQTYTPGTGASTGNNLATLMFMR